MINTPGQTAVGVANLKNGIVNINNSTVSILSSNAVNNFDIVIGVDNSAGGIININNSAISSAVTNGGLSFAVSNDASQGAGTVNIAHSSIFASGDNANIVAGITNQPKNFMGLSGIVNVDQSVINVTSLNNGGGVGAGTFSTGNGTINISNVAMNITGDSGNLFGILILDPTATVNFQNTNIALNLSGTAFGFPTFNVGTLNDNGGNQCMVNGTSVPCTF